MGSNSSSLEDSKVGQALIDKYLVRQRQTFCLEKCIGDNLNGSLTSDEEVCLAICVDKLHRRYNCQREELIKVLGNKDAILNFKNSSTNYIKDLGLNESSTKVQSDY
jgi:hypothetical protein